MHHAGRAIREAAAHAEPQRDQAETIVDGGRRGAILSPQIYPLAPGAIFWNNRFPRPPLGREPTQQEADLIRDRNFRQTRRRDFDDDGYDPHLREFGGTPRFPPTRFETPSGPPVRAVVKWFKPERGFGFVELSDGSGDAFLHATVLERNGIAAVQPGETLEVRVAPGQKGPQVTEVLSVDSSTAAPAAARRSTYPAANRTSTETAVEEVGTVKWFNAQKGFGFIVREGGGKDAFVHASVLERSGIGSLNEGQRVVIDIAEGRKGPEAVKVRLA
jgi:cold shock protein